jgi:ureidoglycolate dehydrogenase (NAD+)
MEDVVISLEELKKITEEKFKKFGISRDHAEIVADVLTHANLRNVNSHGVMRAKHYIERIILGGTNKNPDITVESTGPVSAIIDGDNGLGPVIAKKAMETAINLSKENGMSAVGVINSEHCGSLSYYVEYAAKEGMIGIGTTNANKTVAPFGGKDPYFGTNPIAFGYPTAEHPPVILDMATSNVAMGKIYHAQEKGESIPETWGLNKEGQPTTNPDEVSVLLPIAGPKGYGLGMIVDIFSGILTGSPSGPQILPYQESKKPRRLGHFFTVIDPDIFVGKKQFQQQMDYMIDSIHAQSPAEGFDKVMVPGEPEQIISSKRLREGVPVVKSVYDYLVSEDH